MGCYFLFYHKAWKGPALWSHVTWIRSTDMEKEGQTQTTLISKHKQRIGKKTKGT